MENNIKNPFLKNFKLGVIQIVDTYFETKTSNIFADGFVGKFKEVTEKYYIEQQKHTKLYDTPFDLNVFYGELKPSGRDLFNYIAYKIKDDNDDIEINVAKVSKIIRLTPITIYSAIQQLIDIGVICKKAKSLYWVNPYYMFRGDRIAFYTAQCEDCIEVKATLNKKDNKKKSK